MFQGFRKKKDKRKEENGFFIKNGAAVLEKLISLHNGDCNPIRSYSAQQLHNATGDFRLKIHEDWNYKLYKGAHEDREVLVKKFKSDVDVELEIANEVAIASRMSDHKNVLKLLGCCLETEFPLLVYEFPTLGNLGNHIYRPNDKQTPWEHKLRIVTGIANAVAYLHHGLSKTIIHRDINPTNIYLDENHTAKLFEFQKSIPIPVGETHVEVDKIIWTLPFIAPETAFTGRYTEKFDVFGFGVLLFEILTGKRTHELILSLDKICNLNTSDSRILSDDFGEKIVAEYCEIYGQQNRAQVAEYMKLVLRCVKTDPDERPSMVEVEKALRLIKTI